MGSFDDHSPTVYTVSELTRCIKTLLEQEFPLVWLSGEISNLRTPVSGHHYFTLKDQQAQINAVIFKGPAKRLKYRIENGLSVVGLGRLSVYEPRGTYQILFEHLEPKGIGALQLAFDQLKKRLEDEGLFAAQHKKKLPALPRKIHIITSPTGAVVHDTIQIIQRRFPNMPIVVIPTRVQGDAAENEIMAAIEVLNRQPDAEIAILARGGGSLEDLQPFNSEPLARAIFHSMVPIVSAVGHETDFTIADFVADLRAPTPSAAAEMVVPEKHRLQKQVTEMTSSLARQIGSDITHHRSDLDRLARRLRDPKRQIQELRLKLDYINQQLLRRFNDRIENKRMALRHVATRLYRIPIQEKLLYYQQRLKQIDYNILNIINMQISKKQAQKQALTLQLAALDPLNVLRRGYSIVRSLPEKQVLKTSKSVTINQQVEIQLSAGTLLCRVEGKQP
ncbi:MAG: exodeoxyribonuclease VII large subunit [Desulfobacteraceae bacterium]|nr:exodeoxyribonuclease VII large subunit [Desulfobacteraceae bacterium]MBC2752722.1 exodeoxyribonuclease VII large subunit [Desulfobacteraceae bacterium]